MFELTDPLQSPLALAKFIKPLLGDAPRVREMATQRHIPGLANAVASALYSQAHRARYLQNHRQQVFFTAAKFNLMRMRTKSGLQQQEAAAALGVAQTAVSFWERGMVLPTPRLLMEYVEFLGVERLEAAHLLLDDMKSGLFHFTPAHLALLFTRDNEHGYFSELQWAFTVLEWRWQFGQPVTLKGARFAAGLSKSSLTGIKGYRHATINKLEKGDATCINTKTLMLLATAYTVSPLSILNGLLMTYPALGIKDVIGGQNRSQLVQDQTTEEYIPCNEEEFMHMKNMCILFGLVPEDQTTLFDMLALGELSDETEIENGLVQYRQFPLSADGLMGYRTDEQTRDLTVGIELAEPVEDEVSKWCFHPGVLDGEEAYDVLKVQPFTGLTKVPRWEMAKQFGLDKL